MKNRFWNHLEEYVIGALLVLAVIVVAIQCAVKYLMPSAMSAINELTSYMYIYIAFIGIGYSMKYGADLTVNLFNKIMPPSVKKALSVFHNALYVICYTVLLIGAGLAVRNAAGLSGEATGIPLAGVYFAAIIGYGLGLIRWAERALFKKNKEGTEE